MSRKHCIFLSVLIVLNGVLHAQFVADDSAGCASHTVKFSLDYTIYDTTALTSVEWNFGTGPVVTSFNPPPVTYTVPGIYTVSIIIDGNTAAPVVKTDYIDVYAVPSADFDAIEVNEPYQYTMVPTEAITDTNSSFFYRWTYYRNNNVIRSITKIATSTNADNAIDAFEFPALDTYLITLNLRNSPENCSDSSAVWLIVGEMIPPPVDTTDTTDTADVFIVPNYFVPSSQVYYTIEPEDPDVVLSFKVFTRTGILVFKTESPIVYWDGKNTFGQDCGTGVYYFVLSDLSATTGKKYEQSGFIHIFR